jgi:membrane protein DedA with SNARE-associated domain
MTKFMAGPSIGVAVGMPILGTVVISVLGMMTSVMIFSVIGEKNGYPRISRLIDYVKSKKSINDRFMYLWKRFGVVGVTFLTPVFFTPIIGTILVVAMGSPKTKILLYMFLSAVFWSITLSKIASAVV